MKKPVYYSQKDPRWGKIPYTIDGDKNETIAASGCGPTSMAMVLAEWIDPKITPKETCQLAIDLKDRTPDDGTEWEYFGHVAKKYGLKFQQIARTDDAVKALQTGALVVCSMGPKSKTEPGYFTKGGHYILAYDVQNGEIIVNDPASLERTKATIELFKRESKQYFAFWAPEDPPTFEEAEIIICEEFGLSKEYWVNRKAIDPFFEAREIKIATALRKK